MLQWIRTRSRRDLVLACVIAFCFFAGVTTFLARGVDSVRHEVRHEIRAEFTHAGGVLFEKSFDVREEGRLELHVGDVDVVVHDQAGDAVVRLVADEVEAPPDLLERLGLEVGISDNHLSVRTEEDDWRWGDYDDHDLRLEVMVPPGFDVFVQTGDGDVAVGSFDGEVHVQTGDGDVAVGQTDGPTVRLQTGDGDIVLQGAVGGDVSIRTGDGDVAVVSLLEARNVSVRTGDGDILLAALAAPLDASTGDGNVEVHLATFDGLEIRSGDGDITIFASADMGADVSLHGSDFVIGEDFALRAPVDGRVIEGTLNGGGHELSVRVGDGTIRLERR